MGIEEQPSIQAELRSELTDAMRARDKARANVIRQIETEVSVAKSAPGFDGPVDDDLYQQTIASYVKKMEKARLEYESVGERGRERADELAFEVEYLGRWLPTTLGETETRELVRAAIAELGAGDPKMIGRVIGHVMKAHEGLDGGLVNRIVREELGT
jgi:uncharacterized protein YqeY